MKNERDKYILKEEFHRFIEVCPIQYTLFWKIVYNAGLRISEAINISTKDLLIEENKIIITTLKRKGRPRIPMIIPETLMVELKEHILLNSISGRIFNLSRQYCWRLFKQVCFSADLNPKYSPHSFRHGHGVMISDITNGNMVEIKNRLRHSSIKSTEFYVHVSEKKQQELADKIETYLERGG